MNTVISWLALPLGYIMQWCYTLLNNYGLAIILFTLLTKIVQLPLNIWIQFNSIKMVRIQPEINRIKVKFFGDANTIAEEESKMYKREKYNPFLTLIPLLVQVVLLLGVVAVIYKPFNYLLHFDPSVISQIEEISRAFNHLSADASNVQLAAFQNIVAGDVAPYAAIDGNILAQISSLNFTFLGIDLCMVPSEILSAIPLLALGAPIVAGISAWLLCFCQNASNVLQAEQGKFNQYGLMILSVLLSLYLGYFVPLGIALYWIFSNLFSIAQLYILNYFIPPKKYVDYEELEESRAELAKLKESAKQTKQTPEEKKREKADYKKFFSVANKHIVFYSEKSGFYKYYDCIIEGLLSKVKMPIHYITNDPNDKIFEMAQTNPYIKPYYIGVRKMITLFMKMDADIVVLTTPDLDRMYLKRSLVRKDIEYIYVPHDPMSMSYSFNDHAFDNFDTIFCSGPHIVKEMRATEKLYNTKEKTMVEYGYPLIEKLCEANAKLEKSQDGKKQILIAPSWQEDNLLDSCIDGLINGLYDDDFRIIVRPHPEYVKRYKSKLDVLIEKYSDKVGEKLVFETDFSSNKSVYTSDLLITDWSGIGPEFAISTLKPVLFINTQPKCENENYEAIGIVPQDIALRDVVGQAIDKEEVKNVRNYALSLLDDNSYSEKLLELRNTYFFNFGSNGKFGVDYIFTRIKENIKK
ncbi:MAG: membrane protein insertase YidC [Oscillospiraceae bacterium]|nr:membrane protein insertase YidC [Candidatus Ruminococcus equi]